MTISTSSSFKSTLEQIIQDAFSEINAYGADENIPAEEFNQAKRKLNRMVKTWQGQGYHLWKKFTGILIPSLNVSEYYLNTTASLVEGFILQDNSLPILDGNVLSGSTYVTLTSVAGITVNDNIVVTLSNGTYYADTIGNIVGKDVYFSSGTLSGDASDGAAVFVYPDSYKITDVFSIYGVNNRVLLTATPYTYQSIPLHPLSWLDFFTLTQKSSNGAPTTYSFNREIDFIRFSIWPVPVNNIPFLEMMVYRKIHDFDVNSNNADFPQEWENALVLGLALRLAPSVGKLTNAAYAQLQAQAVEALSTAANFDQEVASLFFSPARY